MKASFRTFALPLLLLPLGLASGAAYANGNVHYPSFPPAVGASVPGVIISQALGLDDDGGAIEEARDGSEPAAEDKSESALGFLRRLEEKNADIKSLRGRFQQVRSSSIFLENIESRGEFWYSHPNLFRCDYFEPSELRYYLIGNTAYIYTPELNQVEQMSMESGGGAAINQLLVGFGLNVDVILEVFDVGLAEKQPSDSNQLAIDFVSKDLDRSLGYSSIRITFDRENLDPKLLEMEQEDDTVVVRLQGVDRDVEIDPAKFRAEFPANVEVHRF